MRGLAHSVLFKPLTVKFHSSGGSANADRHRCEEPQDQGRARQVDCTGRLAVIRDVTDRTVLAQAQALQHLDPLLACAPFGFVFLDRDLRFVRINDQLAEMHGQSVAAHLGKTLAEIVPTMETTLREVTERILATGQPVLNHEFSGETPRAPGITRFWSESWYPVRDERGEIIGFGAIVEDVTERKQAEAALRGNSDLFYKIIDQAPGGVYVVDAQFRVAQMNAESLPFFTSAQPLIGRDFDEALGIVWGPEIGPQIASIFRHTLATGERYVSPRFSEQRQDIGVEQAFEWETQRITLPDGQLGVVCYFKDVTERERAEELLRLTNERFELAVKASQAVLFQQDLDLRFTWLHNPVPGIDGSNAVGKREADLLERAEDVAFIDGLKREVIRSGVGMKREFSPQILGVIHCFEVIVEPLRNAAGHITGITGAAIEITERKRAEATLRETERQYQALAEASEEIPYRMSADWSTLLPLDGRGLFESSDSPLNDWAWLDQNLPRDEHARVKQAINEAIAQKNLFEMEHRVLRHDGFTSWVRSRAVPLLDENEALVAWFGAASDITERKRIELNLIEATAIAEKANRAKSDFLSSMSHELRTPLNAILGFAQLLESGAPAPTPAQQDNLEQILKGGWYLLKLINELLDLAQIETGELSLTQEPVSFAEVMLECRAMIEPQARKRAINMIFPSFEHVGYVHADRTRVKQIVINLLSNAIKYNKAQGTLTVEVALRSPDAIRVSVRDTGEGLAPEKLAQLFQPFNRLGKEAGPEEGTGIGLALSRRLIELMGGTIGAESEVGVGSVFWFELKCVSA